MAVGHHLKIVKLPNLS